MNLCLSVCRSVALQYLSHIHATPEGLSLCTFNKYSHALLSSCLLCSLEACGEAVTFHLRSFGSIWQFASDGTSVTVCVAVWLVLCRSDAEGAERVVAVIWLGGVSDGDCIVDGTQCYEN